MTVKELAAGKDLGPREKCRYSVGCQNMAAPGRWSCSKHLRLISDRRKKSRGVSPSDSWVAPLTVHTPPALLAAMKDTSQDYRLTKLGDEWLWDGEYVEKPVEPNTSLSFAIARYGQRAKATYPKHDKRNFGNLATVECRRCGNTALDATSGMIKTQLCGACYRECKGT